MIRTLPLFPGADTTTPPHSGSRTSRQAAAAIQPNAATLRAAVLRYLNQRGGRGATDQEIQMALNMGGDTERPRRGELVAGGLVEDSGFTRKTSTGREATVWVAVAEGAE